MSKEKITRADFNGLGIYDLELLKRFGRAGKKLIRSEKYNKKEVLGLFSQLIDPQKFQHRDDVPSAR
ncbi:MAG: hypothetical protein R2764_20760 [Bacteroidales bacterium]